MSGTPNKIENLPLTETAPALSDWAVINRPGVQAKKVLHEKLRDLYKTSWDADITSAINSALSSILNYRGDYTPSGNYPSTGGSGTAGAIKKGNVFLIAGLGTGVTALMGSVTVQDGDMAIAKIDTPGNTDANWTVIENNLGFVPENAANKDTSNGYVGLSTWKIKFRNIANSFTSFLRNTSTAARTYDFPDKDITVAGLDDIQSGATDYAIATGTNTYAITLSPTPSAYSAGQMFRVKFTNANSGASTLNVNALGAKSLVKIDGSALASGDLPAGASVVCLYDGTNFFVIGLASAGGGTSGITIGTTTVTGGGTTQLLFNLAGVVSSSSGLTFASGLLTVLGITQQAKFAYDLTHHAGLTVDINGNLTVALTGTSPENKFNQKVNAYGTLFVTNSTGTGYGITMNHYTIQGGGAGLVMIGGTGTINNNNGVEITTHNQATGHRVFVNQYLQSATATAMKWQTSLSPASWGTPADRLLLRADGNFTIGGATFPSKLYVESTTIQFQIGYDSTHHAGFTVDINGNLTILLTGTTPAIKLSTKLQLLDVDVILGTTTGSKIGSSSSEKLAIWGKTPIVQPTTAIALTVHTAVGGTAINDNDTFGGYTVGQLFTAAINFGLLA